MGIPKLIILLCCTSYCIASHSHNIPVEGYSTELEDLGQHVEIPETPVKIIKITKTVAVKIPVPYPVKVREKVPYPVHVAKPYPVPVPQIIKVPHIASPKASQHEGDDKAPSYQVQEDGWSQGGNSFVPSEGQSYGGVHSGQSQSFDEDFSHDGSSGSSYDSPAGSYYGHSGNSNSNLGNESFEAKSYDQAIQEYLSKHQPSGDTGSSGYNYH